MGEERENEEVSSLLCELDILIREIREKPQIVHNKSLGPVRADPEYRIKRHWAAESARHGLLIYQHTCITTHRGQVEKEMRHINTGKYTHDIKFQPDSIFSSKMTTYGTKQQSLRQTNVSQYLKCYFYWKKLQQFYCVHILLLNCCDKLSRTSWVGESWFQKNLVCRRHSDGPTTSLLGNRRGYGRVGGGIQFRKTKSEFVRVTTQSLLTLSGYDSYERDIGCFRALERLWQGRGGMN